jgi:hypothetical protein
MTSNSAPRIQNRFTAIGPPRTLSRFQAAQAGWVAKLQAQHLELFRAGKNRCAWWFHTNSSAVPSLRELSIEWPGLTLLLEWDSEENERLIGLAKATKGKVELCQFAY